MDKYDLLEGCRAERFPWRNVHHNEAFCKEVEIEMLFVCDSLINWKIIRAEINQLFK